MLECLLVVADTLANVGYIVTELDVNPVIVGMLFCQILQLPNHYLLILNAEYFHQNQMHIVSITCTFKASLAMA